MMQSVSVEIRPNMATEGGRVETYNWEHYSRGLGSCQLPHQLQIPTSRTGLLSTLEGAFVKLHVEGLILSLPPPPTVGGGSDAAPGRTWTVDSVLANFNTGSSVPVTIPRVSSVGWRVGQRQVYSGTYPLTFAWTTPFKLRVILTIVGTCITGESSYSSTPQSSSSGNSGPLIAAAFNNPEDQLSDFKIICEGETFLCHKIFLSLWSPVFKGMFQSDTKERKEGQVTIGEMWGRMS